MQKTAILLAAQARKAMESAYAPYSKFRVGACLVTNRGTFYSGCNVENASYGLTICAERVAIGSMVTAGERVIAGIAIAGSTEQGCSPCGACRQVIREFAQPETPIYLCNGRGEIIETVTLAALLPLSFGPEFLET